MQTIPSDIAQQVIENSEYVAALERAVEAARVYLAALDVPRTPSQPHWARVNLREAVKEVELSR